MRLSIIVPAVGPQSDLDNTLVSVLENRPANTEIVVPHAEKYQDPYGLSDEVRFVASDGDQPLHLLNVGIQASRGEVIHLLHSGMEVTPNWTASILDRFDAEPDVAAIGSSIKGSSKADLAGVRYRAGGTAKHVRVKRRQTAEIDGPCIEAGFSASRPSPRLGRSMKNLASTTRTPTRQPSYDAPDSNPCTSPAA